MRKRTILFLVLALCYVGYDVKAQSGITIGTNISNLYVDDVDDENAKVGLAIGVYNKSKLGGPLGIQYELLYAQKGAALQYDNFLQGSGTYRFNLNYIKLPVMLTADAGPLSLHAGPYASLLLSANIKDVDGDGSINSIQELDRDDFNTFDYGLAAGISHAFTGGSIGLRYNYGLKQVGKDGSGAAQAANNAKNSALQIYLGIDF